MTSRVKGSPSVNVCVFCGSHSPETPAPRCAHGRVATVHGLDARQAAAKLWIAFQALEAHRLAFATALDAELRDGRATVDHCPRVTYQGENVVFLHGRDVILGDDPTRNAVG